MAIGAKIGGLEDQLGIANRIGMYNRHPIGKLYSGLQTG